MSLLNFLRVIDGIQSRGGKDAPAPRNRRLELERLERRAVLTELDSVLSTLEPVETTTIETTLELPPPPEEIAVYDDGGSGSGTGEPDLADPTSDPTTDPLPSTDGGSGSGTGDPTDPPPDNGGSGSGSGAAPSITSLESDRMGLWVSFVGSVSDADGPVEGLTVYFVIGNSSTVAFTATVAADGTFSSAGQLLEVGIEIFAYTVDAQGNESLIATCLA